MKYFEVLESLEEKKYINKEKNHRYNEIQYYIPLDIQKMVSKERR